MPVLSAEPDRPEGFGYKIAWMAVKGAPEDVLKILALDDVVPANWSTGLAAGYAGRVFVSPKVGEWTLIVSWGFPFLEERPSPEEEAASAEEPRGFAAFKAIFLPLARSFPDVQYFGTYRVVDYHAWVRALDGRIVRMFAYVGSSGEVIVNFGARTTEEAAVGIADYTGLSVDEATDKTFEEGDFSPNESWVTHLAGAWSIDPTTLGEGEFPQGVGVVGQLTPVT